MNDASYTTTFTVDQTPEEAFAAINNVRGWWSGEIDGHTDQLSAEFTYRYGDVWTGTGITFDSCSSAWGFYITSSLRNLITTGKGQPND